MEIISLDVMIDLPGRINGKLRPDEWYRHLPAIPFTYPPQPDPSPLAEKVAGALREWPCCEYCHRYFSPKTGLSFYTTLARENGWLAIPPTSFCSDCCVRATYYTNPMYLQDTMRGWRHVGL